MHNKKFIFVVDANFHLHHDLYSELLMDTRFVVTKVLSVRQVLDIENTFSNFLAKQNMIIMNPSLPDHGHYGGHDATHHGKTTGLYLYRDKFEHLQAQVVVWARSDEEALDHWGKNVVSRIIIPRKTKHSFLGTAKEFLH